jgi:hypothetical protein
MEPFIFEVLEEYIFTENNQESVILGEEGEEMFDVPPMIPSTVPVLQNSEINNQKRGKNFHWILLQEYGSLDDANDFVKSQTNWVKFREHVTQDGRKEYFQCNVSKDCKATLQLFAIM